MGKKKVVWVWTEKANAIIKKKKICGVELRSKPLQSWIDKGYVEVKKG